MKLLEMKLFSGLSVGIFAFLVWWSAYSISILNSPISNVDAVSTDRISINPCSLFAHSDYLLNKPIALDALLYRYVDGPEGVFVYSGDGLDCGTSDPDRSYHSSDFDLRIFTTLDLSDYVGPNAKIGHLLATTKKGSEIDVRIEGILRRSPTKIDPLRYKLVPTNIKLLSPWRPFTPKGAA